MSRLGCMAVRSVAGFRRRPLRSGLILFITFAILTPPGYYAWLVVEWRRAKSDFAAERYEDVDRRIARCASLWPDNPELVLLRAKSLRRQGKWAEAERELRKYYSLGDVPRDEAQFETLLLRVQTGDDEAVDPLFQLVEDGHPEAAAILEAVSLSYMRRLRYQAANACLSRWIELRPDQAKPYDWRGWIYERTSSRSLAYQDYTKALELDPSLAVVRLRLVELLLEENKVPEADPHLAILKQQEPDRIEVQARLGMLRFLEGRSSEARSLLEGVEPRLAKSDIAPVVYLARLDVQEGRGADAERRLRRVIEVDPTESEARFVLVTALRLQGREAEAVATERDQNRIRERNERVNTLLRDRADKADATVDEWFEIGRLFTEMKMDSRAAYWYEKVLARDPNHNGARRAVAEQLPRPGVPALPGR